MSMTNLLKTGQLKDLEGRHRQLYRLVELSVTLNSTLDLNELLDLIITTATELLECEGASLLLYDDKPPRLFFAAATGSDPAELGCFSKIIGSAEITFSTPLFAESSPKLNKTFLPSTPNKSL